MSRPTLVLANGATVRRTPTKKRLELEYRADTPRKQNIRLELPDFVRSVFHLPDRVLDLLELAAFVYTTDRLVTRGSADATQYDAWARSFVFHVRVRDAAFWQRADVQQALSEALEFMTGDARYVFRFEGGHATARTGLFDTEQFMMPASLKPDVLLFSGGLDSLAGAIELLEHGRDVCLVSHRSQSGTMKTQAALTKALKDHAAYRDRVRPYQFNCTLRGIKAVEETQRSRAFLYTSIAFALQVAFGTDRIHVFENGVTTFNFPRRGDQLNARASRTTHPKTMRLLEALFTRIAERPIVIEQPFLWKTKVDVLTTIKKAGHDMLIASSVSCSETRTSQGTTPQCGTCFQCIDRRFAAFAAGLTDADHTGLYAHDVNTEALHGEPRTVVVDLIRQAKRFAESSADFFEREHANELVDIVDGLHPMSEPEIVTQVWELCRAHGLHVEAALLAIRQEFDRPYRTVVADSLVDLIRQKEYLKEPIPRAVASFVQRAEPQLERLYGGGNRPKNEDEFNRAVASILGTARQDLVSEHPTARFACAGVKPDHEMENANVLIESKYIRNGTPPSKVTEGMAADLIKYPQDKHVLFVVYDPEHQIRDTSVFIRDFEKHGRCSVRVLR